MSKPFLEDLGAEARPNNRKRPHKYAENRPKSEKTPRHKSPNRGNWQKKNPKNFSRPFRQTSVPSYVLESRKAMGDGGIVVVLYIADREARTILFTPRIESRGFFLPHEVRDGHKFLLQVSRARYEETLKDVPDIETKDLEKIIKHDIEKAILEKYDRSTVVLPLISFV